MGISWRKLNKKASIPQTMAIKSACVPMLERTLWYAIWFVLQNAAGADVAAAIIGLGVLALGHTAAASRVNEVEGVVVVHTGNNAHVAHATTARTSLEEHQVARLQVVLLDAHAIKNLSARRAVQLDAEALEDVAGETGAIKAPGGHGSITIRRTAETVCILNDLVNDVVTAVLLKLLEHGALTAITQLL